MPAAPARAVPVARPVEPDAQPVPEGGRVAGQRAPGLAGAVRGAPAVHVAAHPGGEQVRPARRAARRGRSATPLPGGAGGGTQNEAKNTSLLWPRRRHFVHSKFKSIPQPLCY